MAAASHDAFFDYVDRWMYEDDREFEHEINKYFANEPLVDEAKSWFHQGYTGGRWVKNACEKYPPTCEAPTDGWKTCE